MLEIYDKLKADNSDKVIIIRKGKFYYCFFKDAYIILELFNYKMTGDYCSFSDVTKVMRKLIDVNIGYVMYNDGEVNISYGDYLNYENYYMDGYDKHKKNLIVDKISNLSSQDFNKLISICLDIGIRL